VKLWRKIKSFSLNLNYCYRNTVLTPIRAYGILCHMGAKLVYWEKFVYSDAAVREMVLWQLPKATSDRPHGFKYRLYYGLSNGICIVRYDNETGKGDHRHFRGQEGPYHFSDVETLITDFLTDIEEVRRKS